MASSFVLRSFSVALLTIWFALTGITQELPRYRCFSDHQEIHGWLKAFNRGVDANGIVTQNQKYSPLILSIYGILAYDRFLETGDSSYYAAVIDQYKFFKDTTYCKVSNDGNYMKLVYNYNYSDLKAPWHSGMTQGTAVSFVLRYYKLTQDKTALTIAQQLMNFMLLDEEDGGTITCTPENFCFIEEYPNSKKSRHVFNGFVNGLIGLYEYLLFFENERAKMVFDDGYQSIFTVLEKYDTPTWTNYNRSGKSIHEQYMRYQMSQFEHLYAIFGDPRFLDQIQIWGMMAYNRFDKSIKFYKNPTFQYASKLEKIDEEGKTTLKYTPQDPIYSCHPENRVLKEQLSKSNTLKLQFYDPIEELELSFDQEIKLSKLRLFDQSKQRLKVLKASDTLYQVHFNNDHPSVLHLTYKAPKNKSIALRSANGKCISNYTNPHYVFTTTEPIKMSQGLEYAVKLDGVNISRATIFYRYSGLDDFSRTAKWHYDQKVKELKFVAPMNGQMQFMLSIETNENPVFVEEFSVVPLH